MPNWGMNPESLHGVGGSISRNQTPEARSATSGMLSCADDASGVVHHPIMKGALGGFVETWAGLANRLVHNVEAAGSQIQDAAVTGVDADLEAEDGQRPALAAVTAQQSVLSKPINV